MEHSSAGIKAEQGSAMADISRKSIGGEYVDTIGGEVQQLADADHFIRCPSCGGWIECSDLDSVFAHNGPLAYRLVTRCTVRLGACSTLVGDEFGTGGGEFETKSVKLISVRFDQQSGSGIWVDGPNAR